MPMAALKVLVMAAEDPDPPLAPGEMVSMCITEAQPVLPLPIKQLYLPHLLSSSGLALSQAAYL